MSREIPLMALSIGLLTLWKTLRFQTRSGKWEVGKKGSSDISNSELIFDGEFLQHPASNVVDDQEITLLDISDTNCMLSCTSG